MSIKEDFEFWKDATSFIEELLPKDTEQRIREHVKKRGFNHNEACLFRHYIVQAFDMKPMSANLKDSIDRQSEEMSEQICLDDNCVFTTNGVCEQQPSKYRKCVSTKRHLDVQPNSLWDYDRSLCESENRIGLKVKEVKDNKVYFFEKMAYEGYGIEYFDGKTFKPHVKKK